MTIQELEKFINEYGKGIYSFCKKLCKNSDLADELYQDVWLKACKNIVELKTDQNVKSYLISLAIGIWNNRRRKYAWRNRIAHKRNGRYAVTDLRINRKNISKNWWMNGVQQVWKL
jgi:RNA polymerase sigma-70 factor (ECF subfamily)